MGTKVTVGVAINDGVYSTAEATFIGTNIARFWHDPHLRVYLEEAIAIANKNMDIFDFCNFLYSQVNNNIRRRYGGKELQLESVSLYKSDGKMSVTSIE